MENFYSILGLEHNATPDMIKKSYRKLAMKYHPDRNQGNKDYEEKFKSIQKAYETLIDPQLKFQYDLSLKQNRFNSTNRSPFNNFDNSTFNHDSFEEVFNDFFNNNFSDFFNNIRHQQIIINTDISFWESVFGTTKTFEIKLSKSNRSFNTKTLNIKIPPGINDGEVLTLVFEGLEIHIHISVIKDKQFFRDGLDIYTNIIIPLTTALLGGDIKIKHWDKELTITIPPNTQFGDKISIPNCGIKKDVFVGDFIIICNIELPKKLNKKQIEIIKELEKTQNVKNNTFFESLQSIWNNLKQKTSF